MKILYLSEKAIHERPPLVWFHLYQIHGRGKSIELERLVDASVGEIEGNGEWLLVRIGIDHGELKAWKKHPGGEGPHCVLTESEFPPSRGDGMQFLILGSGGL